MPHISPRLHAALRDAVAARFGQPLRYPSHCDALEAELQKAAHTAGRRLSPSTLRRFFGLVEKEGGYHLHTLDTLARYAGHADFASFGQAIASLVKAADNTPPAGLADIPELLAMENLARPEQLLLGYFLGRVTRPTHPRGPAGPLALRLAAHPAGQEFFVESFVDLAHLNGAYGEVLEEYLQHKHTPEAQLFGHCVLFLGEFLAEDEAAWRRRLPHLLALPVPADVHAFPRGRRAFAELISAWFDAPNRPVAPALLARLQQEAAAMPRIPTPSPRLPAFYNHFPGGYYFHVAEALFLTGQFAPLLEWLDFTQAELPELAHLEANVYNELLRAFRAVAEFRTGRAPAGATSIQSLFHLESHIWLLDYYQVHTWLVELHLAAGPAAPEVPQLLKEVKEFAELHRMPFFERVAQRIVAGWQ
ncbi:hypothetical protein Q3A66_07790 [Hymenobacter sp. BT770]|uniref:hypothetical protein n=1 Tax=Hymenobacter sp. BT770 TaxID=2886942 RepID=UPI001D0FEB8B|nr:hypothetical protein [Hymenobacter sp. BT770]MCC3152893.1 hypothetical protein [Hymenobacter sp. BT770]MDO3414968.1 hypothetical protein [Hymenobacter sp. BT770]